MEENAVTLPAGCQISTAVSSATQAMQAADAAKVAKPHAGSSLEKHFYIGVLAALFAAFAFSLNFVVPFIIGGYSTFDFALAAGRRHRPCASLPESAHRWIHAQHR